MNDEKTPTLPKNNSQTSDEKVNEFAEKMRSRETEMKRKILMLSSFCLSIIILLVVLFIKYYHDCHEERENIDNITTTVSEKLLDYSTDPHSRVDCTNQEPCTEWTCGYVKSHFHRTPEECEYHDWSDYVTYMIYGLLICACLQALCVKEAKK